MFMIGVGFIVMAFSGAMLKRELLLKDQEGLVDQIDVGEGDRRMLFHPDWKKWGNGTDIAY